jgi:hypothetical protein
MANELETPADASTIRMLSRLLKEGGPELAPTSPSMYGGGPMTPSHRPLSLPKIEQQPTRRPKTVGERMERFEAGLRTRVEAMPPEDRPDEEQVREVVANARSGLEKGESGEEDKITQAEAASLEGVIEIDGTRPSLFVAKGFTDLDHNDVGDWQGLLQRMERGLRKVIAAVGGIRVGGNVQGTAFVIGRVGNDGLVITNRHVLQDIAKPVNGSQEWTLILQLHFGGRALPVTGFSKELMGAPPERPGEDHGEIGWAKGLADVREKAAQLRHAERHQLGKLIA